MAENISSDALKALARELLEVEKKFLLDEKEQYGIAVAVVVTPESRYWEDIEFDTAEEKIAAYASVVEHAKENGAVAIITLNSSFWKPVNNSKEVQDYQWGDLEASGAPRAIAVTISGPGLDPCAMSLPYTFENGSVVLGEPTEFEPALINLSPNWP